MLDLFRNEEFIVSVGENVVKMLQIIFWSSEMPQLKRSLLTLPASHSMIDQWRAIKIKPSRSTHDDTECLFHFQNMVKD